MVAGPSRLVKGASDELSSSRDGWTHPGISKIHHRRHTLRAEMPLSEVHLRHVACRVRRPTRSHVAFAHGTSCVETKRKGLD